MSVIGWASEGSLRVEEFALTGPELTANRTAGLLRRADIYNADYLWVENSQQVILDDFAEAGYEAVSDNGVKTLLKNRSPAGYILEFDRDVLAIGADLA